MSSRPRPIKAKSAASPPAPAEAAQASEAAPDAIRLRGVRQNNLKGFDLDLPLGRLIVITGLSGSGKSSLGFDTLYAEGQRRYIETFSPYARQFFDRMDKPAVDRIENIPPAIALEQRNAVRTTRSTVGTMTEVCDHMKVLWSHLAQLHCRKCGRPVRKDTPQGIWQELTQDAGARDTERLLTFDLPLSSKLSVSDQLALVARQGFQRVLVEGRIVRVDDAAPHVPTDSPGLTVIQDRVRLSSTNRTRFIEACEQALHFGKGSLSIRTVPIEGAAGQGEIRRFSSALHCAECDVSYREPSPALFSYNHPLGACPKCRGFGRVIDIDYGLVMPDHSKTLAQVVVKPWQGGVSAECQVDMMKAARKRGVPTDVPFESLSPEHRRWVVEGDPGYIPDDPAHSWPKLWYGVKGYFRWLESKSYKMHVRVLLSRYRSYTPCPECNGRRFNPDSLLFRLAASAPGSGRAGGLTLADFYALPVRDARAVVEGLAAGLGSARTDPLSVVLEEIRARLGYLVEVGLGYVSLDRPTRTLSGGETERVNLTTCLGTRLVNTLFVLDEPSVGLHPRDTDRLIRILERLRTAGNTVVVIEHEASVMRAADQIVDIGPGHGEAGGRVVFQGTPAQLSSATGSLTGEYLTGRRRIEVPRRRQVATDDNGRIASPRLRLSQVSANNLRDLTVELPLGRLVCVTGVSGSGKSTLVRDVLLPLLQSRLRDAEVAANGSDAGPGEAEAGGDEDLGAETGATRASLDGHEALGNVVLVDQTALGKTPRSNPAVYVGAFEDMREFFASTPEARERGLNASSFSFNSASGQCGRCRGAGFEKIEMQFLSDVFVRCPECQGRRYRPHILEVAVRPGDAAEVRGWSIADLLEAPIEDAVVFLEAFPGSKPARRAAAALRLLCDVGLGYLRSGQPINTLSGGESQRLKLASHVASSGAMPGLESATPYVAARSSVFLFDEPTTGLHFDDVRVLLVVLQRLVDAGHSVVVIEHNLDVIKSADWLVDLGPDAGDEGGRLVACGTPESVAQCAASHTGRFLRGVLG